MIISKIIHFILIHQINYLKYLLIYLSSQNEHVIPQVSKSHVSKQDTNSVFSCYEKNIISTSNGKDQSKQKFYLNIAGKEQLIDLKTLFKDECYPLINCVDFLYYNKMIHLIMKLTFTYVQVISQTLSLNSQYYIWVYQEYADKNNFNISFSFQIRCVVSRSLIPLLKYINLQKNQLILFSYYKNLKYKGDDVFNQLVKHS